MFIGHYGAGLGVKKLDPVVSLGTFFLAAQFLDLLWPIFLLLGIEHVSIDPGNTVLAPLDFSYYPFSHSLAAALTWGLIFGGVYYLIKKNTRNALLLGLLVLSHWILDLLVHAPDLPIAPGLNLKVGLGLWNLPALEIIIELLFFASGVFYYLKVTKAKNKQGKFGLWGLVIFLLLIHISNLLGPPPPDVTTIAVVGNFQWLIIIWAYWVDRNRVSGS